MEPLINRLLQRWRSDPAIAENIACWLTLPERSARWADFPNNLHPRLKQALQKNGLQKLYSHQVQCWDSAQAGHNRVIVTGTASGKTLCYNLPILDAFLKDPQTSALYLFPTKALTNDQQQSLFSLISAIVQDENPPEQAAIHIPLSIYDGDTPKHERSRLRSRPGLLLTNPDMLHMG
jgi:DEAD/DEAH box helicase domain-containing protein